MQLVLSAQDSKNLTLELDTLNNGVKTCSIPVDETQTKQLQTCIKAYQNAPHSDTLLTIGYQLFQFLNKQPTVIQAWLQDPNNRQLTIQTDAAPNPLQVLLLNLPWEVLAVDGQFLASDDRLYEVVRRVGPADQNTPKAQYKDLTLMFMAADPDYKSGLDYEAEERAILQATRKAKNINLWVEETGNLDNLSTRIRELGHCDMLHLSCYGVEDEQHGFVLELKDDKGRLQLAHPRDFNLLHPQIKCLFLSACHSSQMGDKPAFAQQLAQLGMENIIGWNGAVSDTQATEYTQHVYTALGANATVAYACAYARQQLLKNKREHWHLGQVYLSAKGGLPLVDRRKPKNKTNRIKSSHELLDKQKRVVRVASRETFVGRRKETKRALQVFDQKEYAGVLLLGIGGTGKSSLAARIAHRLAPHHRTAVVYKEYGATDLLVAIQAASPNGKTVRDAFTEYLTEIRDDEARLQDIIVEILEDYLADSPIILIVDDMEQHALEPLQHTPLEQEKLWVKPEYQYSLTALINAFEEADTESFLLFTSRQHFAVFDSRSQDVAERLYAIDVPDMNASERERHWRALVQTQDNQTRDTDKDEELLSRIWAVSHGNAGLQDVLYQPLLKGEIATLEATLTQLAQHRADKENQITQEELGKYLERIALEHYHEALTDNEQQCLRVLTIFDFAIPQELIIQAAPKLGIAEPERVLTRLGHFGLLNHWQGEGLEGHISCYGLVNKVVEPLELEDRNFIARVCAPLLWRIWFLDFVISEFELDAEAVKKAKLAHLLPLELLQQLVTLELSGLQQKYPHTQDEKAIFTSVKAFTPTDHQHISQLHSLCLNNTLQNWQELACSPTHFIDLLETSLALSFFEKLEVSYAGLSGITEHQFKKLIHILEEERSKYKALDNQHDSDLLKIIMQLFSGNTDLMTRAYRIYLKAEKKEALELFQNIDTNNEEQQLQIRIKAAKTKQQKADVYGEHALFLAHQKQDFDKTENFYERAIEAEPNHAINLGNYALFLENQKQDFDKAEVFYERAIEADPNRANTLGNYANFLTNQKQDFEKAEIFYERAIEADPNDATNLGNYANFLTSQKQDFDKAENFYERAIEAESDDPNILGNYANFLKNQKQDLDKAEIFYERAIEAEPNHANNLGNYAKFLFTQNKHSQAQQYLEQAESQPDIHPDLAIELAFYRYAHCPPHNLNPIKQLLQTGNRSIDWDLSDNVKRAQHDNHPHPELLAAIAQVISGEQDIEQLNQYPQWTQT